MFIQLPGKIGADLSALLIIFNKKQRWQEILKYARSKGLNDAEIKYVLMGGWKDSHAKGEEHYLKIMELVGEKPYFGENELPF